MHICKCYPISFYLRNVRYSLLVVVTHAVGLRYRTDSIILGSIYSIILCWNEELSTHEDDKKRTLNMKIHPSQKVSQTVGDHQENERETHAQVISKHTKNEHVYSKANRI